MKKPYLYVEARGWFSTPSTTGNRAEGTLEGPISFDSVCIEAKDDVEAYQLGAARLQTSQIEDSTMTNEDESIVAGSHRSGQFLNDYVVAL